MRIITPREFNFREIAKLRCQTRPRGNPGGRKKAQARYKNIVTAFDIETSRLPDIEQGIMYIWQWAFGPDLVVVGRYWDELDAFVTQLGYACGEDKIVVYVHNLSFEFSYLRGIWRFEPDDVFAIKSRKILKATHGCLEFRCSYLQTNMSLDEFTHKMGVEHQKLSGAEYDYNKIRYPWTPMTDAELAYCVHDVVGLVEALMTEMAADNDNLYSIPLTSTGYVRRDIKKAVHDLVSRSYIETQVPTLWLYNLLRAGFRGGDVHANRYFVGQKLTNAHKADRSSSYPDIVCNDTFPVSQFYEMRGKRLDYDELMTLILVRDKAVIMRAAITGLRLRDPYWPAPYLSKDKCDNVMLPEAGDWIDNGRILGADYLETVLTDVDLRIIAKEYTWTDIVFYDVAYARYGRLPDAIVKETIRYYRLKTELKGDPDAAIYYTKSKNKLNAIYGMMAQVPIRKALKYIQDGVIDEYGITDYYVEDQSKTDKQLLEEYKHRAFSLYQWGCWVTAWARYRLHEAIWEIDRQQADFVYCDTDSVVYLGPVDWSDYNDARTAASSAHGAYAVDANGTTHYMGVMEQEDDCAAFKTLGAKKYCYTDDRGRLHLTVAGVGKKAGAEELEAAGGIDAFKVGFTFVSEAGGVEAVYNDDPQLEPLQVDGHELPITANVVLRPSTYRLGVGQEYEILLRHRQYGIDF